MSELTYLLLKLGFLLLLWFFIFAIVYALRTDLFGERVRRTPSEQQAGQPTPPSPMPAASSGSASSSPSGSARRLVITSGAKAGMELQLSDQPLTIGRAGDSGLVIRDDYTSTHHARLVLWGDEWVVQDLDSTNGTFLDGKRVSAATPIPLNTPVKIGTTSFELRR